jgi:hypothetical protein
MRFSEHFRDPLVKNLNVSFNFAVSVVHARSNFVQGGSGRLRGGLTRKNALHGEYQIFFGILLESTVVLQISDVAVRIRFGKFAGRSAPSFHGLKDLVGAVSI